MKTMALATLWVATLALSPWLTGGCQPAEAPTSLAQAPDMPQVRSIEEAAWRPEESLNSPVVAQVNGVPIVLAQLEEAIEGDDGVRSPEQNLDKLIELEVLAQAALAKGYYRAEVVLPVLRPALVHGLLAGTFLLPEPASFFNEETLKALYYSPNIRVKFDHVDVFRVADAQFLCCPGDFNECEPEDFESCMKEEEPHVAEVQEALRQGASDFPSFRQLVEEWQLTYPRLGFHTYSFFYNVNLPHSEQKGYNVFNENIARAATKLRQGELSPPVRSRNAWHLLFLVEHIPEQHRTLDDPSVRAEIIEKALPQKLKAEYQALVEGLRQRYGVEIYPDRVDLLFGAAAPAPD